MNNRRKRPGHVRCDAATKVRLRRIGENKAIFPNGADMADVLDYLSRVALDISAVDAEKRAKALRQSEGGAV